MRTRNLFVLSMLFLTLLHQPAIAQDNAGPEGGDWALQFQITDDFKLNQFQGSIISAKYHSSEQNAWRVGLGLDFRSSTEEREDSFEGVPVSSGSSESSLQSVQLGFQYVRYVNPEAKVQFLFGGGPFGMWTSSSLDQFDEAGEPVATSGTDLWEIGLSGLVGVEWFVASRIGLHAEYGFQFGYASSESEQTVIPQDRTGRRERDSVQFEARSVLFGVSVYF